MDARTSCWTATSSRAHTAATCSSWAENPSWWTTPTTTTSLPAGSSTSTRRPTGEREGCDMIDALFAGMFGLGVAIYSAIPNYVGDLFGFLFGDVLGIGMGDLIGLAILGGIVLVVIWALWKEFLFATFDPLGAGASGLNVNALDYLFLGLIALTIVVSIQAVGIILVVAMLTTPAATAQLLTARFGRLIAIAIAIGIASGIAGIYVSFWLNLASGASIVLIQTATFLLALALGPRGGLLRRRPVETAATR